MSQVVVKEKNKIAKVMEGIGMFFTALTASDAIAIDNPEEEVKASGIKELVNSGERIKSIETMYVEKENSIKGIQTKINAKGKNPKIEVASKEETEKDDELER